MDSDELEYLALSQIAYGKSRHGYGITAAINQRCDTGLKPKKLYPVLSRFEEMGWTNVTLSRDSMAGPGKVEHSITTAGLAARDDMERRLRARVERVVKSINVVEAQKKASDVEGQRINLGA